ncbi:FtsX-like permease family protein [Aggregicoccus sp. 17bor-14]|uniref:ADOP family duplicated permease n=1 Tax=Myxococcaceae TaxID=31 RepID=UPI00129CE9FC|nr:MULTISPECIES: ADOP family duplicated permease [Myxococcaceae]MBF5046393.1 ABC transporter permease [Simulacricoccus sp. 17bor-14]MRI92113.1 FtsX-like permease family protein [Aggregicoccus sp. 17bor-14]
MTSLSLAARQLRRAPLFALLATGVLALGLGAALTVAEVVDAVLLRPLPFAAPERLVNAWQTNLRAGGTNLTVTGADFLAWAQEREAFERFAAVSARGFNLAGAEQPERLEGAIVSADFFALLGTAPLLGRVPQPGAAGPRTAVLSEALWRSRFGGAPDVVGRTVSLDGEPVEVVGVMPARFRYPATAELWVCARTRVPEHPTYPIDPEHDRSRHYLTVLARLRPGVSLSQAQAALQVVQKRLGEQAPQEERDVGATLLPLREQLYGKLRPQLLGLLGVAALLLLVGWANVAHLSLARAVGRAHEVAVRVALGATRGALWRSFFAEALVLSVAAAALGPLLTSWAAPLLVAASPQAASLPAPELSSRVVLLALALALACAASLGLIAALQPVRAGEALKEGGRGGGGGRRQSRLRSALLVFEVALSLVLLLGAGLLVRSFARLTAVDPGFRAEGVLAVDLPLPKARYPDAAAQRRAMGELLRRLQAEPTVDAAGLVSRLPLSPSNTVGDLTIPGREAEAFPLDLRLATEGYFEALRIPLRTGRTFTARDADSDAPPAVILNETAARRAFPAGNALGQRILVWGEETPSEVVGVVGDVRHTGLDAEPRPEAWRPVGAVGWPNLTLVVRGKVRAGALLPVVRADVAALDRELPLVHPQEMGERVDASLALRRFSRELLGAMALVAALLALAGIYGVTAYGVAQRRRELGVRLALGASPAGLIGLVTRETLLRVGAGCVLGLAAGVGLSRLLEGLLFGVQRVDPLTFALLPLALTAAAALAAAGAAARAGRIDPAEALRRP